MVTFFICLAILVFGGLFYGRFVSRQFEPDDRETPAVRHNDGVDYVIMPKWKMFLIQLLNIAGIGPIFGALQGAMWGPVVFLWITFGSVLAGGVHDYFSGMISARNDGKSVAEISGMYLGSAVQNIMRVLTVIMLLMVGTVFAVSPAGLLTELFSGSGSSLLTSTAFWLGLIFVYYFIATFISIDKIIGKLYPVFGLCLIIMAVGVMLGIFTNEEYVIPELWDHFYNMNANGKPILPYMFVTVACGAISGFHSTQSPLMARCLKSEHQGRLVFYNAMISEGVIALIWAAAGCAIYEVTGGLNTGLADILANKTQAQVVFDVCEKTMPGAVGVVLAVLGVMACPITSGDTAFRSARLTVADWLNIDQQNPKKRLMLCIPVLGVGIALGFAQVTGLVDYGIVWRYFSFSNQTLATVVLWVTTVYLLKTGRNYIVALVPAVFMTDIISTYFLCAGECLGLSTAIGYPVGLGITVFALAFFMYKKSSLRRNKA